jgi:hypothetical protein
MPDSKKNKPGDTVRYEPGHGQGFGHAAKGEELTAEMTELDITPGTEGLYMQDDEDSGWPIFQWVDAQGIDRITTIELDTFNNDFIKV